MSERVGWDNVRQLPFIRRHPHGVPLDRSELLRCTFCGHVPEPGGCICRTCVCCENGDCGGLKKSAGMPIVGVERG